MTETLEHLVRKDNLHEKNELLRKSEISLWIDTYDDIFSDFDPRPFSQRALSQDFLDETKRASQSISGKTQLSFLVRADIQNAKIESNIKKRIKDHFKKHYEELRKEKKGIIKEGIIFAIIGIALMALASYILFTTTQNNFFIHFIIVLLEPGGWFLFWEGLDLAIFNARAKNDDLSFYKNLSEAEIVFIPY